MTPLEEALSFFVATSDACSEALTVDDPTADRPELPPLSEVVVGLVDHCDRSGP